MSTQVSTIQSQASNPQPGDSILWESFDAAGWHALDLFYNAAIPKHCCELDYDAWKKRKRQLLRTAHRRFTQACRFAGTSNIHCGRSLIGLAWAEYLQLLQNSSPDPHVTHASRVSTMLEKANDAKSKLESVDDDKVRLYLGLAYHLLGVLYLESCQGNQAQESLINAKNTYESVGETNRIYDVLHLLAKIQQCRRDIKSSGFDKSFEYFQEIEKSTDLERRARAFLGKVTTLHWIGQTRTAWQHYALWKKLEPELELKLQSQLATRQESQLDPVVHARLLFRGRLLFAAIATRYGELAEAAKIFCAIEESIRCQKELSEFCLAIYYFLRAEHCLEKGDVLGMERWLEKITWKDPVPRSGYDCFEILYLGSSCRQCISECYVCETWCCDACGCCSPELVVFQKDTKSVPFDIQRMFTLMMEGLRGRSHYVNGDLAKAETLLTVVVRDITTVFPPDSSVVLPYKIALLKVLQARDNDGERILACSNEILRQLGKLIGRRLAFESDVERVLGLWRSELSEDDVAVTILNEALKKALNARHPSHPEVLALRADIIQVQSQLPSSDLRALSTAISQIIDQLSAVVDCFDYRRLAAMRTAAWISLLGHCFHQAEFCFTRLERMWLELQARNHTAIQCGDSRVILGRVAAQIEAGTPMHEEVEQLHLGIQHIAANSDLSSLAHDLNRIGLILLWHKCFQSSYYFVRKSLDQYESMGNQANATIVRESIAVIKLETLEAGVELAEL